jgi:hypothetical protein
VSRRRPADGLNGNPGVASMRSGVMQVDVMQSSVLQPRRYQLLRQRKKYQKDLSMALYTKHPTLLRRVAAHIPVIPRMHQ